MESNLKLCFVLVSILIGMTNFDGYIGLGLNRVEGQNSKASCVYPYCDRTLAQVQAAGPGGDGCAGKKCPGYYKSVLSCYNLANKFIYRYDYYSCSLSGSSCILRRFNCSGALSPVINKDGTYDVFNRYVAANAHCTGTPPPAPPCPPAKNTTITTTTPATPIVDNSIITTIAGD